MNELNLGITIMIGAVGTLLWYLITKQISTIEANILERKTEIHEMSKEVKEDFKLVWSEIKEFKENYLDRFDKVNTNINASTKMLSDMIHELDKKIK